MAMGFGAVEWGYVIIAFSLLGMLAGSGCIIFGIVSIVNDIWGPWGPIVWGILLLILGVAGVVSGVAMRKTWALWYMIISIVGIVVLLLLALLWIGLLSKKCKDDGNDKASDCWRAEKGLLLTGILSAVFMLVFCFCFIIIINKFRILLKEEDTGGYRII